MPTKRSLCRVLLLSAGLLATCVTMAQSTSTHLKKGADKRATVLTPSDTINFDYHAQVRQWPLMATGQVNVGTYTTDWLSTTMQGTGNVIRITAQTNYAPAARVATIPLMLGSTKGGELVVKQAGFDPTLSYSLTVLPITSATGNAQHSSEGIDKSYDGDLTTIYHSPYNREMPQTLTYTLAQASRVDQIVYTPRQDGSSNGHWGTIVVRYTTQNNPNYTTLGTFDLKESGNTSAIDMNVEGVKRIEIVVQTGAGSFASAAEVAFVQNPATNTNAAIAEAAKTIFTDELCSALRPGVTAADIDALSEPLLKSIGHVLLAGGYDTEFRRNTFEPYEPVELLRRRMKMQHTYNSWENPTGIYFEEGKATILIVHGIQDGHAPSLIIKNWGKAHANELQRQSAYPLRNGINVITPAHRGNGYIAYYDEAYATLPNIDVHFYAAKVNGYFDPNEGHDNTKWKKLLANATSDIMDMRGTYVQMAYPVARLRQSCPNDGLSVVQFSDSSVASSRQLLGFFRYNINPRNRQMAHVVWSGFMHANNSGANVVDNHVSAWTSPSSANFGFWGFAHELGHNSQLTPDFKYAGLGETSNNIFSAWAEFTLTTNTSQPYRLETEVSGQNNYSHLLGGRFNAYLEEGVRKGVSWQLQPGPDYSGEAFQTVTVPNEDYDGRRGADTTVQTKNFDHFVKLVPLWQLQLYCHQAGFSPDIWAKLHQAWRTTELNSIASSGKYQIRFMKLVCDSTQTNFLPFFRKAGLLRPINAYIQDYTPDWLKINEQMIAELEAYVASKGYPEPAGLPEYISALNWRTYRDRLSIPAATVNTGTQRNGSRVYVMHNTWQNVVAFETFDADGNLTAISMWGLGGNASNSHTQVLFPSGSKRIDAIGWDGQRVTCYQE